VIIFSVDFIEQQKQQTDCDGQTDGQTEIWPQHRPIPLLAYREAVKNLQRMQTTRHNLSKVTNAVLSSEIDKHAYGVYSYSCFTCYAAHLCATTHRRDNRRDRGTLVPHRLRWWTNILHSSFPQLLGRSFQKATNFTASIVTSMRLDQSFHFNYSTLRRNFTCFIISI